jgi:hypothetical protein
MPEVVSGPGIPQVVPGVTSPTVEVFQGDRLVFTPQPYYAPRPQRNGMPARIYRLALEPGRYFVTTTTSASKESVKVTSRTLTRISVFAGFSPSTRHFRDCAM